jgi:MinD-like ATPase involved in chromosome partitioning or flagellar assembly
VTDRNSEASGEQPQLRPEPDDRGQPIVRRPQSPADTRPTGIIPLPQPEVLGPPAERGLDAESPAFGRWTSRSNMQQPTDVLRLRADPANQETVAAPRPVTSDDGIDETVGAPLATTPARAPGLDYVASAPPPPAPRPETGPPLEAAHAVPPRAEQGPPPAPVSWSYVEGLRASELVPTRKVPPGRGWRRALYRASFGLINLGPGPAERRQAQREAKIRSLLRGHYKIGVLGKGGTGKTTIAAAVGSILASLRQDDRVVAIDADTAFGKLASRIDPRAAGSYWELAADQHLHTFADIRSRVGNNAAGLFVLAGEAATARRRLLNPQIYREASARLDRHFTISIIDCGSTMDSPVTQAVLRDLDALIVVSSPWVDAASAAGQTMEWLANHGYTGLLHRTVVVLNDSDGHADKRTRSALSEQFARRGQVVIEVPFDPHLRPGGVIDVDNELHRSTRRRFDEIAAAIAEHFVTTTDGPRGRR